MRNPGLGWELATIQAPAPRLTVSGIPAHVSPPSKRPPPPAPLAPWQRSASAPRSAGGFGAEHATEPARAGAPHPQLEPGWPPGPAAGASGRCRRESFRTFHLGKQRANMGNCTVTVFIGRDTRPRHDAASAPIPMTQLKKAILQRLDNLRPQGELAALLAGFLFAEMRRGHGWSPVPL